MRECNTIPKKTIKHWEKKCLKEVLITILKKITFFIDKTWKQIKVFFAEMI